MKKITYEQNLLIAAMKEASELSIELSKALRFGLGNYHPDQPDIKNSIRIVEEYLRLQAIIEKMQADCMLPTFGDYEKKLKEQHIGRIDYLYCFDYNQNDKF